MSTIILVHGAFADQTAWAAVKPVLESKRQSLQALAQPEEYASLLLGLMEI